MQRRVTDEDWRRWRVELDGAPIGDVAGFDTDEGWLEIVDPAGPAPAVGSRSRQRRIAVQRPTPVLRVHRDWDLVDLLNHVVVARVRR